MPPTPAKVVTIITSFLGKDAVERLFGQLGVRGFTAADVRGFGVHGKLPESVLAAGKNVAYSVVTTPAVADKLLAAVEREILSRFPGIAYCCDAVALLH